MGYRMLKLPHREDRTLAQVKLLAFVVYSSWTKITLGAFSGGEIFGIIVGTFGLAGMLYVSYNKRYDIEYFVSSFIPSNTGIVVKIYF